MAGLEAPIVILVLGLIIYGFIVTVLYVREQHARNETEDLLLMAMERIESLEARESKNRPD